MRTDETEENNNKGNLTLEILVEKAVQDSEGALYDLCERIAKGVLFRATCIMGGRADAEDVAQEVLIRVCAKIRDLRDPKVFGVWLGRIITNEANRHMAENSRRGVVLNIDDYLEAIMEEKDDFLPQEYAENEEYRKVVMEIISNLPMRQREAVIFHYYDGLSVTETAEAMNITRQSVSEYLALARERLKREMQNQHFDIGKFGMITAGPFISKVLHQEASFFLSGNEAWAQQALAQCQGVTAAIPMNTTAGSIAFQAPSGLLAGAIAAVCTTAAIIAGVSFGNISRNSAAEASIEGKVVFSGGINYGANIVYVNPTQAQADANSTGGELTAVYWWITESGDETILYSGESGVVEDALIQLQENEEDGEYIVYFRLEDEAGAVHKLGSNFYILTGAQESG